MGTFSFIDVYCQLLGTTMGKRSLDLNADILCSLSFTDHRGHFKIDSCAFRVHGPGVHGHTYKELFQRVSA